MKKIKEIVVLSGKGGTGKTTVSSVLARLWKNHIVVDADVDAANLHFLMQHKIKDKKEFISNKIPNFDHSLCTLCKVCVNQCRFNALSLREQKVVVNRSRCEGCTLCGLVCPQKAIQIEEELTGYYYISETPFATLIHADLLPGSENSGKLITRIRSLSKDAAESEGSEFILVDGPPGIACPAISSVTGADYAVIVTEPTPSGLHDLLRIVEAVKIFKIPLGVVINKHDINPQITLEIEKNMQKQGIVIMGRIDYDERMVDLLNEYKTPVDLERSDPLRKMFEEISEKILEQIQ